MATIVAVCPYCRVGGVRAPASAVGASATCPKCGSSFTVMPSDGAPGWAAKQPPAKQNTEKTGSPQPTSPPKPAAPPAPPAPPDETKPSVAMADATEPSPLAAAAPKSASKPARKSAPESAPEPEPAVAQTAVAAERVEFDEPEPAADTGLVVALMALVLVGVAVLSSLFPYGRYIALGLAGVGGLLGLLALGGEERAKLAGAAAALLHLGIAAVVVFLPDWLGLDPWRGPPRPEEPKGPVAIQHGSGAPVPLAPGDTVDAARSSWEFKDLRVTAKAAVGPVELLGPKDAKRTPKESYLYLTLQVRNIGVEREIPLSGWAAGQGTEGVRVIDPSGKALAPATFPAGFAPTELGKPAPRAMPGHQSEVTLLFAAPPAKAEFVRVQLPGTAIGMTDELKFRVGPLGPVLPRLPGP